MLAKFLWRRSWGLADSSGVFLPGVGISKSVPLLIKGGQLCNHGGGRDRAGRAVPEGLGRYHSRGAEEKGGGGRKAERIGGNLHAASHPELDQKGTAHLEEPRGWRPELAKAALKGKLPCHLSAASPSPKLVRSNPQRQHVGFLLASCIGPTVHNAVWKSILGLVQLMLC